MSLFDVIIKPLELLFEFLFSVSYRICPDPAISIVILSICVSTLVFPLYHQADKLQKASKDREKQLKPRIDHIKKTFKGDEKIMMLNTYYRVSGYNPLSSLSSTVSLLLQIPFFMAAYSFLSDLSVLKGKSCLFISDLSKPDMAFSVGGSAINILPIVMTVINIVSVEMISRGEPLKNRIMMYILPVVFLILLYNSPSGLVLYWTCNNVYSLIKNIVARSVRPGRKDSGKEDKAASGTRSRIIYPLIYLWIMLGIFIPSNVLSSSPLEFIDRSSFDDPVRYIIYSAVIMFGVFIIWPMIYYLVSTAAGKRIITLIAYAMSIIFTVDYFIFGNDNERLSTEFLVDGGVAPGTFMIIFNLILLIIAAAGAVLLTRFPRISHIVAISGVAALIGLSGMKIISMEQKVRDYKRYGTEQGAGPANNVGGDSTVGSDMTIRLSREGQNVIVIMLDRGIGAMIPYIFNEIPQLTDQFDGFVYYPNTISFGDRTTYGAPALCGGYEYTPYAINERKTELLRDKHNEALKVMPLLFSDNGYDVTVIDAPFANYSVVPDSSIYDDIPEINAFSLKGVMNEDFYGRAHEAQVTRNRNMLMYTVMKTAPLFLQEYIYDSGNYHSMGVVFDSSTELDKMITPQIPDGTSKATGILESFMDWYTSLAGLGGITRFDAEGDSYVFMCNDITHEANILQEPDYVPAIRTDNTTYDKEHATRFTVDGRTMDVTSYEQMAHYHVNASAYCRLGEWFDRLRQEGIWDNTRIIITSDHGFNLGQFDELILDEYGVDIEAYSSILLFKDFGSHGFTTDNKLMTTADVPYMSVSGLIDDPVNPFTGNPLTDLSGYGSPVMIMRENSKYLDEENGTLLGPGRWFSAGNDIWDKNDWEYVGDS